MWGEWCDGGECVGDGGGCRGRSFCSAQRSPHSNDDSNLALRLYRKEATTTGRAPTWRRAALPYWTRGCPPKLIFAVFRHDTLLS